MNEVADEMKDDQLGTKGSTPEGTHALVGYILQEPDRTIYLHPHSERFPIHKATDVVAHTDPAPLLELLKHQLYLGSLVTLLQSLEFVLRAFLANLPGARPSGRPYGEDIYTLPVGTEVAVDDITSYETLGELIDRYNEEVQTRRLGTPIDRTLTEVRDAVAHGRVSASKANNRLRLLKFGKPHKDRVRITFNEVMTEEWFTQHNMRVNTAILAAHKAYLELKRGGASRDGGGKDSGAISPA